MHPPLCARKIFQSAVKAVQPDLLIHGNIARQGNILKFGDHEHELKHNVYIVGFGKAVAGMCRIVQDIVAEHVACGALSVPLGLIDDLTSAGKINLIPKKDGRIVIYEGAHHNRPDEASLRAASEIRKICVLAEEESLVITLVSGGASISFNETTCTYNLACPWELPHRMGQQTWYFNLIPIGRNSMSTIKKTVVCNHVGQTKRKKHDEQEVEGGSALLPSPIPPLKLEEKNETVRILAAEGATIQELNVIRQNLSMLKGGRLGKLALPAKVWSFILSDIIGDPPELIASGPTVSSTSKPSDAIRLLRKYHVENLISKNVFSVLDTLRQNENKIDSCAKMKHVFNKVVGNNAIALRSAQEEAERLGFVPLALSCKLQGEAKLLGCVFAYLATFLCGNVMEQDTRLKSYLTGHGASELEVDTFFSSLTSVHSNKKLCILAGGETTVALTRDHGVGGRNQEMVLSFAKELHELTNGSTNSSLSKHCITFLSAGTDGQDGPTPAAGAIFSSTDFETFNYSTATEHLANHDSYSYFSCTGNDHGSVITGLTGTNVMDIHVLIVEPKLQ